MRMTMLRILVLVFCVTAPTFAADPADLKSQAKARKQSGDARGALELFNKLAEVEPASADIEDEIGFLLAVLNQPAEAKAHFQRATTLQRSYAPAWYHL